MTSVGKAVADQLRLHRREGDIPQLLPAVFDAVNGGGFVHPCGSQTMYVIRAGMDFKLRCTGCGREFMVPRNKIERRIKQIRRDAPESEE